MTYLETYFDEIYTRYAALILHYVALRVADRDIAEDIVATTFLRFWKKLQQDIIIEHEKTYLFLIAKGLIVDYYRSKKTNQWSLDSVHELLEDPHINIEKQVVQKIAYEEILSHLQQLPAQYQDIIVFYYVQSLSIEEIAIILEKKQGAVRVLIHRALAALKKTYERT